MRAEAPEADRDGHRPAGGRLLIGEIIRRAAESVPDAPAVTVARPSADTGKPRLYDTLSYAELERDAARLAQRLKNDFGIRRGDRVLGWADTSLNVLPLFIALAKLGAVFAPLGARLGLEEARAIAPLAKATLLVVDADRAGDAEALAQAARAKGWAVLSAGSDSRIKERSATESGSADRSDRDAKERDPQQAPFEVPAAHRLDASSLPDPRQVIDDPDLVEDDPHVIFFTSGSTGRPKGVVLSHRANWLRGFQGVFRDEPERTVCMFPLYHMAAFTLAISAWQTRGEIIYTDAAAESLLDAAEKRRANRLYGLPAIWKRILEIETDRFDLTALTQLDTGTSATPIEMVRAIKERFPAARVRIYYGSTEVGSALALSDADVLRKPGSVGLPSVQVDVRLAEDSEICVRSPFLTDGYFDDPDATRESFDGEWFRTGDLGAQDAEGYYSVTGRKKEILRTGGESVSPSEVESVLSEMPEIEEVALVGLPDPEWGELLCAAVVPSPGANPSLADLQAFCEGRLARFKKPRRIALLNALPKTPATAQIQRTLLLEEILMKDLARD